MALEISVISTQIIKPSSPTPHHLRHHSLSIIDQYVPPIRVCCILFYPALNDMVSLEPISILKSSLSDTLSDFYPLAGRISNNMSIECNDEGVNFFETRVIGRKFDQVVSGAVGEEIDQLVPKDGFDLGPKVLLSVQLNNFDCGGMALGVCINHKVADASSLSLFLQNWAARARGDNDKIVLVRPKYDITSLFPGKEGVKTLKIPEPSQEVMTRRFVFSASNIAALKAECANSRNMKNPAPTRVEVISAVIWRSAMNAMRMTMVEVKPKSQVHIAVNLRRRLNPPLSNQYVGNIFTVASPVCGTEEAELDSLVDMIHAAVTNDDSKYYGGYREPPIITTEEIQKQKDLQMYIVSSWCRFPFYETDFGWGKPTWTCTAGFPRNFVILMDAKDGEGVEAWVVLNEQEMAKFEADPYMIAFTSKATNNGPRSVSSGI